MPLAAMPVEVVPAFFSMPTGTEWLIVLVIALLLFGKRLPEIMRGLGSSVREFKKGIDTGPEPREPVKPVDGAVSRGELPPPSDPNHPKP